MTGLRVVSAHYDDWNPISVLNLESLMARCCNTSGNSSKPESSWYLLPLPILLWMVSWSAASQGFNLAALLIGYTALPCYLVTPFLSFACPCQPVLLHLFPHPPPCPRQTNVSHPYLHLERPPTPNLVGHSQISVTYRRNKTASN